MSRYGPEFEGLGCIDMMLDNIGYVESALILSHCTLKL